MRMEFVEFLSMKRIISILCCLVFSLFSNVTYCAADEVRSELNNNFSKESNAKNIEDKNNVKSDISNNSNEDIFGDEQAFPFIAGLGKNAAH